jgi:hypothetical protein
VSVHINIRIPDELAARIDERAKAESMSQTAVIVNGLWAALCPVETAGFQEALDTRKSRGAQVLPAHKPQVKAKRALGRTPENLSLADNRDARPAHAPGCKCLMCQGK